MQDNHFFNLMNQCVEEQKSLWRIENHYIKESQSAEEREFWEALKKDKEKHIADLLAITKKNCKA